MTSLEFILGAVPFMPHGHCYFWTKNLIFLHALSDALIVLAYASIPFTLIYFIRKRTDMPFHWMFVCFAVFIMACGTTHLMEIWNIWHANYWVAGTIKAITALASVPTAILLIRLVPQGLALPSPSELARVNQELERASAAKDQFLASMSHELRTPLNAIIGFTGTLLMGFPGPLTERQRKQLQTIQASGYHQLSLINDLLDLAKIDSGKVELHLEPIACAAVVTEVADTLRPLAEAKGLNFEVNSRGEMVCNTDRRTLRQILINLSNNAIKFTEQGTIRIDAREQEGAIRFSVTDTGIGIKPEDQGKLFKAFMQFESAGRTHQEGTGLGLHLSQRLAALLGGQIIFSSEPGKGSVFELVIKP